jgi:uncharacterized protein YprB with RNaseH-like and TPR domain
MRDLTSRLRAIVRTPIPDRSGAGDAPRELTYEPELGLTGVMDPEAVADALGGEVRGGEAGRFVAVDRVWDGEAWHGRRQVSSFALDDASRLSFFDPRLEGAPGLAERPVFFDIETTGLSGGAGTVAFLVGCGWFEGASFRVRQFMLAGPAGEAAMLDALAAVFADASLLVTYNGRTFDIPTMETRWAFHRKPSGAEDVPHFDMLPPARRLWGGGDCSLIALERSRLGFFRVGDVPGFEIPGRYFQVLRTGDARVIEDVLEHNRLDLLSLAAVSARALQIAAGGPESCDDAGELAGLGRLCERCGDEDAAIRAYGLAARDADRQTRARTLVRLAILLRRRGRYDEAATAWQGVADAANRQVGLRSIERHAMRALAIHHEHRAQDLEAARRYAERLEAHADGRHADLARHRLNRIDRKLREATDNSGGHEAARLFDQES